MPDNATVTTPSDPSLAYRFFDLVAGDEDARLCRDIPDAQCREQPKSFSYQVLAQAFSKAGDVLADSKIVLPWLLGVVGAPVFLIGWLVPIRESLALLPQMLVGGIIRRFPVRKGFWMASNLLQGVCIAAMGVVPLAGLSGAAAGWGIVALLVLFSMARGVASIASKDTMGKTVSKGKRGRVSGYAATASGLVAAAVGLYLALSPEAARPEWLLYALLIAAGGMWWVSAAAVAAIPEYPGATEGGRGLGDLVRDQVLLLARDRELQRFLLVRALMIATALAGPVYVGLAQRGVGDSLGGLGWLVLAAGLAGAVSSAFWGSLSDRSSRLTMAAAAGLAGILGLAMLAALAVAPGLGETSLLYAAALFVLGIAHAGVRIGRKTHVVDLAGGDRKAEYVALSNSIIGVLLLILGAVTGALMALGLEVALAVLSLLALAGASAALTMKHVQG